MIGYVRVSTAREEMISPELQRTAISDWAARNGRRIVGWLEDLDLSGREFARRRIAEGITAVEAGTAVEIGVYRYDRWGRNALKSAANIQRVEAAGGAVVSVTQPFDATTAVGRYSRTNALALDEMQSDLIGEGWRAAQAHRLDRGLPTSGYQRFGYTYTPRRLGGEGVYLPDEVTGPLLAEAYRRYIAGESLGSVGRWLTAAGSRTYRGHPWRCDSVRRILDTGFGAGLVIIAPRGAGGPTWLPGSHAPVIDKETWAAYLTRRGTVAERAPRLRYATYRLSGLLACGYCQGAAAHTSGKGGAHGAKLVCQRHQRDRSCRPLWLWRTDVEDSVRAWLAEQVSGSEADLAARLARESRRTRVEIDTSTLARERAALDRQLVTLADQVSRGIVPEATYLALRADLETRARDLDTALAGAEQARNAALEPPRPALVGVLEAWDSLEPAAANEVLRTIVGRVDLYRRDDRAPVVRGRWELG